MFIHGKKYTYWCLVALGCELQFGLWTSGFGKTSRQHPVNVISSCALDFSDTNILLTTTTASNEQFTVSCGGMMVKKILLGYWLYPV